MADNITPPNTGSPDPGVGIPVTEEQQTEQERNRVAVVLATLLTLLILSLILVLCLIFVPGAPLNNIVTKDGKENASMVDADKYDANGNDLPDQFEKGKAGKDADAKNDGLLKGGNAGQENPKSIEKLKGNDRLHQKPSASSFNLRLPQGYQLSATATPVGKNSTYRVVNPCGQVPLGTDCTSADFAEAVAQAYEQSGGVYGPMEYDASSAVTGRTYHVRCEAQNGGKVLCLGGRNDSAGIIITKTR